jgi:HSP20 family protein
MALLFSDPFSTLFNLQQMLDASRTSRWLESSPSGFGSYPLLNVFRQGDDCVVLVELPGIKKSELEIQVKDARCASLARRRWNIPRRRACTGASGCPASSIARSRFRSPSMPTG